MTKIKFGIVGLGRIGMIHLDNLLQMGEVEVVAVADLTVLDSPRLLKRLALQGIDLVTTSYETMINSKTLDAVVICTPNESHANYIEIAAKAGIHIFCEKPLDLNLSRVVEVLSVVKDSGVKLMLGFNRRFDKEFIKIHDLVEEGEVGTPHLVKITSRDPKAPSISYIKKSGGLFLDMTIHDFDMARYIVGKEVTEVYAKGAVLVDKKIGEVGDIDTAVVILTYEDQSMAVIDNSREAKYGYDQRIEVFGSKGMVQSNNNFHDSHRLYTVSGVETSLPLHFFLERYAEAYKKELQAFLSCLINGVSPPVNGQDGLISLKIGLAALKSIKEDRPVRIDEI